MLVVNCDRCDQELRDLGALLFTPPSELGNVAKIHICIPCYNDIAIWWNEDQKTRREVDSVDKKALWLHLESEHGMCLGGVWSHAQLLDAHSYEHNSHGGIRNHPEEDRSFSWDKIYAVRKERDQVSQEASDN